MARRTLSALSATVALTAAALVMTPTAAQASPPGTKDVTAVLFEWNFASVAKECTNTLGPAGYGYVQVSPPAEHIQGSQWWTSYQPVSYKIAGRLGDRAAFQNMVSTCHAAGVKVVVDTVINHMSAGSGTGTGGSSYTKYDYPGLYSVYDFDDCTAQVSNYQDRWNVQHCELVGLADLDTGEEYVRKTIAGYMNDLLSLGVDGFRIDAAKHIPAEDLANIKSRLSDPNAYWKQEVIYGAGEAVQPGEYTGTGDVDAFQGAFDLKRIFTGEKLAYLSNWGASWGAGYTASDKARTFVDNWDTERNGSTLSYKDNATYTLANVYLLAWPYGSPNVYSGYEFSDNDAGAPDGGTVNACYTDGWKCQHAWPQIAGMVGFRNAVSGTAVTNWWDDGNNAIAFGRGSKGFVAINHESSALTRTFTTSLPAGTYCDVQHTGATYSVAAGGTFTATVGANDAVALYAGGPCTAPGDSTGGTTGATTGSTGGTTPATGASFAVNATTTWGQNIYVTGDNAALGNWSTGSALPLSSAAYPVWKLDVSLPAGTAFQYKYLRKDGSGNVTWESGGNRTATVPASGKVVLNDTWRN
jgi:alpha-amylase